jgi:hypothetical protein
MNVLTNQRTIMQYSIDMQTRCIVGMSETNVVPQIVIEGRVGCEGGEMRVAKGVVNLGILIWMPDARSRKTCSDCGLAASHFDSASIHLYQKSIIVGTDRRHNHACLVLCAEL